MEYWLNGVCSVIVNIFQLYVISRFMRCFFDRAIVPVYVLWVVYLFRYLAGSIIGAFVGYPLVNLLVSCMCIFFIACCYGGKISKRMVVTAIIILSLLVAEFIFALLIGVIHIDFRDKSVEINVFYEFFLTFIWWCMTLVIARFRNVKYDVKVPGSLTGSIMAVFIITFIMVTVVYQQEYMEQRTAAVFVLGVVLLNVIIIYIYDTLARSLQDRIRLALMEKEQESYLNQIKTMQENYEEIREFRHDNINRLSSMQQMVSDGRFKELQDYLGDILGELESYNKYCDSGNVAIDSILNYLLGKAEKEKINVETAIQLPDELPVIGDDVIVLFGNLLNNAIEANRSVPEGQKKLMLSVGYDKQCMKLSVRNTHANKIKEREGRLLTSKADKSMHGIGLGSVDAIVEKYNGMKKIEYDEHEFKVKIVLVLS